MSMEPSLPPGRAFYLRKGGTDALIDVTASVDRERAELYDLRAENERLRAMWESSIIGLFGERCSTYEEECGVCMAWNDYDGAVKS